MSEWTKGDWEINPVRDPESGAVMVCAGDGHRYGLVACVFRAADARLIAAAPTMAEALEEVLALIAEVAPEYRESTVCAHADAALSLAKRGNRNV